MEDREGTSPRCETCGRVKDPIGRSIALAACGSGCDRECEGYLKDPQPDHLFPGEKQSEFGYPKIDVIYMTRPQQEPPA